MKVCCREDCPHSKQAQPLSNFYLRRDRAGGYKSECKDCCSQDRQRNKDRYEPRVRAYCEANKKAFARRHLVRTYGLDPEVARALVDGELACAVCGSNEKLCIDHCHKTNQVRGVLCSPCNQALGMLQENPERIERLKDYALYCQELKNDGTKNLAPSSY